MVGRTRPGKYKSGVSSSSDEVGGGGTSLLRFAGGTEGWANVGSDVKEISWAGVMVCCDSDTAATASSSSFSEMGLSSSSIRKGSGTSGSV